MKSCKESRVIEVYSTEALKEKIREIKEGEMLTVQIVLPERGRSIKGSEEEDNGKKYKLKQIQVRLKIAEAEPLYSTEPITDSETAARVMASALAQMDREYCCVVNLDNRLHPINFNIVSIGDINRSVVSMQNVFKAAILSNAVSIMLFHNHPSGSLEPSLEDMQITRKLIEAGKIMDIPVLDHIIIAGGTGEYFSFKREFEEMFLMEKGPDYAEKADKPRKTAGRKPSVLKDLKTTGEKSAESGKEKTPRRPRKKDKGAEL